MKLNKNIPLVGDKVTIIKINEKEGLIKEILPRKNFLIRPSVANVDQVFLVFSVLDPKPSLFFIDKILANLELLKIPIFICINKKDLDLKKAESYLEIYNNIGYETIAISTLNPDDVNNLKLLLENKITVFAGASGVGKSTLINKIVDDNLEKTGLISEKTKRGKHTTRHASLIKINKNSFIIDTPGFSTIDFFELKKENLIKLFPDLLSFTNNCKFISCNHVLETSCGVKDALKNRQIYQFRYDNFLKLFNEIKDTKRR